MLNFITVTTPVYITLFWAIVFLTGNNIHSRPKLMLSIFMLVAAMLYTCHAVFFMNFRDIYLALDPLYLFTSLSVYPLYYWYIKLLTSESHLEPYNLVHLVPAMTLAIFLELFLIFATPEEQLQYYQGVLVDNDWSLLAAPGNAGWLARIFIASRMIFALQVLFYLMLGYRQAGKHNDRLEDFYSNTENRKLVWIKLLNISFMTFSTASMVFNFLGRGRFLNHNSLLIIPSALFSSLLFIVGLQGNKQSDSIQEMEPEAENNFHEIFSVKSNNHLKERLHEVMVKDRMYLVPDLKITTLCKILNTNRTYISNMINDEAGCNFNSYVNRFRIEHALDLMNQQGGKDLVIDYIAQESGFGSSSAFIRAFKLYKGMPPGRYLNSISIPEEKEAV
jgi:AraC-like DNA-binding protein